MIAICYSAVAAAVAAPGLDVNELASNAAPALSAILSNTTESGNLQDIDYKQFAEYEPELERMFPNIAREVRGKPDEERFLKYKNQLYEAAFQEIEGSFMNQLRAESQRTGRQIKENTSYTYNYVQDSKGRYPCAYTKYYWLDNGDLDTERCKPDTSGMSVREAAWAERRSICDFPDGYEEHKLYVIKPSNQDKSFCSGDDIRKIYFNTENAADNTRFEYDVSLVHSNMRDITYDGTGGNYSAHLNAYKSTVDYTAYQNWRNQEVEDIRNGLYTDADIDDANNSVYLNKEYLDRWESRHNIPMGSTKGINVDYTMSSQR